MTNEPQVIKQNFYGREKSPTSPRFSSSGLSLVLAAEPFLSVVVVNIELHSILTSPWCSGACMYVCEREYHGIKTRNTRV